MLVDKKGEFTGDLVNLTGRTSNVDAIAKGKTEVYEARARANLKMTRATKQKKINVAGVFSFICAVPRTDALAPEIELDKKVSSKPARELPIKNAGRALARRFISKRSRRGVFAAGDVRCDSVKRVASAVGEGSMAMRFVHEYLKEV